MLLNIHAHAVYHTPQEMPAIVQVEIAPPGDQATGQQVLEEELWIGPPLESEEFSDIFRNRNRRLTAPADANIAIDYRARVLLEGDTATLAPRDARSVEIACLPPQVLAMLFPSRYCESDRLAQAAQDLFGSTQGGAQTVYAICDWMREKVLYEYGHTDANTSAVDIFIERAGVCRDFSHLAISFCRALNIPARYAAGYCLELDPPDFHAYFQAYLATESGGQDNEPGRWYSFDATWQGLRRGLVNISVGRDAVDTSMLTFFGTAQLVEQSVSVVEGVVEGEAKDE
jgi:transglutaminase-like putative cysteine protease